MDYTMNSVLVNMRVRDAMKAAEESFAPGGSEDMCIAGVF